MEEEIRELDRAGADMFHVDFFDGNFVENIGMVLGTMLFDHPRSEYARIIQELKAP